MSREDFMRQLEALLEDVPQEEKQEALSYYQSYFEDAGTENEERILRELESPQKVAATIKADLGMSQESGIGEYTEHGFTDSRFQDRQEINIRKSPAQGQPEDTAAGGRLAGEGKEPGFQNAYGNEDFPNYQNAFGHGGNASYGSYGRDDGAAPYGNYGRDDGAAPYGNYGRDDGTAPYGNYGKNDGRDDGSASYGGSYRNASESTYSGNQILKIILIVAIVVLTSPAWLGVIGGVAGTVFGLGIAVVCVTISFFIVGGVLFGIGIGQMAAGSLGVGFALSGTGMLILALAVLSTLLCVWVCGKLIPWICRAVKGLWRGFFARKERRI